VPPTLKKVPPPALLDKGNVAKIHIYVSFVNLWGFPINKNNATELPEQRLK